MPRPDPASRIPRMYSCRLSSVLFAFAPAPEAYIGRSDLLTIKLAHVLPLRWLWRNHDGSMMAVWERTATWQTTLAAWRPKRPRRTPATRPQPTSIDTA